MPTPPELRAGPESLPGLRGGHYDAPPPPNPDHEQRKPGRTAHHAGDAPPLALGVAVRRGLSAAVRASGPVSEDPPPQLCPRTRTRPLPSVTATTASPPRLHSAPCAPPFLGRSVSPSSPAPLRAPPRRPNQTPCFCFVFSTPPRGGARDFPRRDLSLLGNIRK